MVKAAGVVLRDPLMITDCARLLGLSSRRVQQLFDSEVLHGVRTPTGARLIDRAEVLRYVAVRQRAAENGRGR